MEVDNTTGYGPMSGGFAPTAAERAHQENLRRSAMDIMEYSMIHSMQFDRIRRNIARPMAGGQDAADDWLFNSRAGYAARAGLAAVMNRDPLGIGSPLHFAAGIQQSVGTGGTGGMILRDSTVPGGGLRSFGGAGALTNHVSKQLYSQLQNDFFGSGRSDVSGLNQSQMGTLLSELARRGSFRGEVATLRSADMLERLGQMRDMSDPRIRQKTSGIRNQADLEAAMKQAEESGDTQLYDALKRVNDSRQILDVNQDARAKFRKMGESAAGMLAALGDAVKSTNVKDLLDQAEGILGQSITNEQDALRVKRTIEEVKSFSRARGIDPASVLQDMGAARESVFSQLTGSGWSATAAQRVSAQVGRTSTLAGIASSLDSGMNGMTGFSAWEATAMNAAGQVARINENPELVAAAAFLKTGEGSIDNKTRADLSASLREFGSAGTEQERSAIRSRINKLIYEQTGRSAIDWMGGQSGMQEYLRDSDITRMATDSLDANVVASVMRRGALQAYRNSTKGEKTMLGPDGAKLAGMVTSSFTENTQAELNRVLREDPNKLREFLAARSGMLVDSAGNSVSVDEAMSMFGETTTYEAKAKGLRSYGRRFSMLNYTKAGRSKEAVDKELANNAAAMLDQGVGLEQRTRDRGFLASLLEGLLVGPDGAVSDAALVGVASEQAGKKNFRNTRTGNFKLNADGHYADATVSKIRKLIGGEGEAALTDRAGMSLDDFSSALRSGDARATSMWNDLIMGPDYAAASLDGKSITVVDRESRNEADRMFTAAGRREAVKDVLFQDGDGAGYTSFIPTPGGGSYSVAAGKTRDLMMQFNRGGDLGMDIVAGMQNNGLIEKIAKGDKDAISRLGELNQLSGGELISAMETARDSANARMHDSSRSEEQRERSKAARDKLQKGLDALQNPANPSTMSVGVLKVTRVEPPGGAHEL